MESRGFIEGNGAAEKPAFTKRCISLRAPLIEFQGAWTVDQVTVSKRLTFWDRSLIYHGVGKFEGILL